MTEIRAERDRRLVASDGPMLRATERGTPADVAAWKAYRQALRDLPPTARPAVDACVTPEVLAAYEPTWPAELVG